MFLTLHLLHSESQFLVFYLIRTNFCCSLCRFACIKNVIIIMYLPRIIDGTDFKEFLSNKFESFEISMAGYSQLNCTAIYVFL